MNTALSIIIPVFREADIIFDTLGTILSLPVSVPFEIIVSDGEPEGSTLACLKKEKQMIRTRPVKLVSSPTGRGPQINAGVLASSGSLLFVLHADTRLDKIGMDMMIKAWQRTEKPLFCGAFDLCIDSKKKVFRIMEKTASLRSRLTKLPYGDQGIFMTRRLFDKTGGFPNTPIMEDVGMMLKIKKTGVCPVFIDRTISTSARRWERQGLVYTTLKNWVLISLFSLGVSPKKLAEFY